MTRYPADIPSLTSLRFFAALWVVLYHYVRWLPATTAPPADVPIVSQGYMAVDFFFILSGFILTHAHLRPIERAALHPRAFLVKRIARLYPLHLATLGFYLALVGLAAVAGIALPNPERYTASQFLLNILLVHAWQIRDAGAWNYPSWSISAEWAAYLLFPALSALIVRRAARIPALPLLLGGIAVFLAMAGLAHPLLGVGYFDLHANFGWYRILPEFTAGMLLYRIGLEGRAGWLGAPVVLPLLAVAILSACLWHDPLIAVLLLGALILATAEASRRPGRRWLAGRAMVYLGTLSYALYMVHLPVATVMLQGGPRLLGVGPAALLAPAILVVLLAAAAAHHLVEVPAYRWISKRPSIRRRSPGTALPAPVPALREAAGRPNSPSCE